MTDKSSAVSRWSVLLIALSLSACGKESVDKDIGAQQAAYKEKYATAKALFEERCKTAGIVVKRTVKDVEGIELTKIRQPIPWGSKAYFDPMFEGAAMAGESSGGSYVWQFLQSEFRYAHTPERRGSLGPPHTAPGHQQLPPTRGYRYVEYVDASTGKWMRCEAARSSGSARSVDELMECKAVTKPLSGFAVDFEDVVDRTDRALWVAGTKLKVIDKRTGEVIAELTKYVWDPGFGGRATGRWPWEHANSAASTVCPSDATRMHGFDSRYFVDTVLIPVQGE